MPRTTSNSAADSYLELIREFPLRRIKSRADHAQAKAMVLRLAGQKPDRGAEEYLDVLVELIADFERRSGWTISSARLSANELVRHRIEERRLSITALAKQIGLPQSNLSEMLAGKRGWSKAAIRALSKLLHIRAERFLG
jgi:HTH-type transcriptional regulator/antitoxin HigA